MVVFNAEGDGQHSFLVYSIVKGHTIRPIVSHIYRVWGIGRLSLHRFYHNLRLGERNGLTLFFSINFKFSEAGR